MMTSPSRTASPGATREREQAQRLAAALAHDLRTPLSSLSGEVELALLRDRSPEEYRQALARIGGRIAELLELSADLAVLGEPPEAVLQEPVGLDEILVAAARVPAAAERLIVRSATHSRVVLGERSRLPRAIALLATHAIRQLRPSARLELFIAEDRADGDATLTISLEATPPGFHPRAWAYVAGDVAAGANAPGEFALRAAARMIADCGGTLALTTGTREGVIVRLRCA